MPYKYQAYAKTIISEIPLPLMGAGISADAGTSVPTDIVTLKRGKISTNIGYTHTLEETGIRYAVATDHIIIDVKGAAVFNIIQPDEVIFDPYTHPRRSPERTEEIIGSCFLHLVLQFLITGSTQFLFHGSAVALPDNAGALILIGNKGAGKSTIAAALSLSGCRLLCDDIVPIVHVGGPSVMPGVARAKLLPDAYQKLFGGSEPAGHLFDGMSKYYTDLSHAKNTSPLTAIIYLEQKPVSSVTIAPLQGSRKFQKMITQVIRIDGLDTPEILFTTVIENCRNIPLYRVTIPANTADPRMVSTRILEYIQSSIKSPKESVCIHSPQP